MQNYRNNAMPYNYRQMQPVPRANNCRLESMKEQHLAMAYVPWQAWKNLYDAEKGFHCGTIFQELNLPFTGKGGARR